MIVLMSSEWQHLPDYQLVLSVDIFWPTIVMIPLLQLFSNYRYMGILPCSSTGRHLLSRPNVCWSLYLLLIILLMTDSACGFNIQNIHRSMQILSYVVDLLILWWLRPCYHMSLIHFCCFSLLFFTLQFCKFFSARIL